jgi:hypothetical protein
MNLAAVERFSIPAGVVRETDRALRDAGRSGNECFVLWSGVIRDTTFEVRTYHLPAQTRYQLASGLCVRIDGDELHRFNRWLFSAGEILGVQVHSHPTHAFHSTTDDTYPIVTLLGGISIVVPYFARHGLQGGGIAVFRLQTAGWTSLPPRAVRNLLDFGR